MSSAGGRVAGKVIIVTGAASGIGAASARRLAAEGAKLMLTDMNAETLEATAEALGSKDVATMRHNVTFDMEWSAVVLAAKDRFGRIDGLVNNAGVGIGTPLLTSTLDEWHAVTSVNLDGVFLGMRHACPVMAENGGGSVINISSILGKVGQPGAAAYCASKGGVALLTKSAALELAPLGIRVNSVHPGYIETPMVADAIHRSENGNEMREMLISRHALGRLGRAPEIAEGIVFLSSDESSFMTGSELVIDGGYTAA